MNRRRRKTNSMKRKPFLPLRWVIYLLLLTMLATGVSLSRYKTTVAGSGTVSVARPVVEFADESLTDILAMRPGDSVERAFSVTNRGQNQVKMAYRLSVQNMPNILTAVILRAGAPVNLSDWIDIGFASEEVHQYTLRLTWTGSADAESMGQAWSPSIRLEAEQVDE